MDEIKLAIQKAIMPIQAKFSAHDAKRLIKKTDDYIRFLEGLIKRHKGD